VSNALETGVSMFPYPGLRPYEKSEADLFFGREEHVDQLLGKLERDRFLAVIGPSGCGKSSLVRAGMLAALESGFMAKAGLCWRTAVMRPGGQPLANLASALLAPDGLGRRMDDAHDELAFLGATLRRGPLGLVEAFRDAGLPERTNLLVLVDQFEEIFRFHRLGGTTEANAFVELLLASAAEPTVSIYVVLTMRSDHLGNCPIFRGLPEAMNESQFLTPRLTREQNRAAIVGPAKMFGVEIQPDVVTRILNEMGTNPDQLPLMQHLLLRMWRRATQGRLESDYGGSITMTMEDYEAVGGLAKALSNHVERIYQKLPDAAAKRIAEAAFRNLTEVTPDGHVVRRPASLAEICAVADASLEQVVPVLDEFRSEGRSFLMPPIAEPLDPAKVIDISHESLIRQWQRLLDWTKDEDKARQTAGVVTRELHKWQESDRDEGALLHGLRLLEAEEWAKTHPKQVRPDERDFLKASRDLRDREARRRRRVTRVIRALGVVCFVSFVLCLIGLLQAEAQRRKAEHLRQRAESAEKAATDESEVAKKEKDTAREQLRQNLENKARGLAGASRHLLEQGDAAGALAMAFEAKKSMTTPSAKFEPPKEVERALLSALCSWKGEPALLPLFPASDQKISSIAFSPNGRWLVAGGSGSAAQRWHLEGGPRRMTPVTLDGHAESVTMVAVSDGDAKVATLDQEGAIRLFGPKPTAYETSRVLLKGDQGQASVIALSRDGRWLAAGGMQGKAWLWSLKDPDRTAAAVALPGHFRDVVCLAIDRDGHHLATADLNGTVLLWDLTVSGKAPGSQPLTGHSNMPVYALAFSSDGQRLATASLDGSCGIWDIQKPKPVERVVLRQGAPRLVSVAFSSDGHRLATGAAGLIQVWDVEDPTKAPLELSAPPGGIAKLAFSPNEGRYLAADSYSNTILLWDISGVNPVAISLRAANVAPTPLPGNVLPAHFGRFAFNPDGRSLVTRNGQGGLLAWDLSNLDTSNPFDPFARRGSSPDWFGTLLAQGAGVGAGTTASAADQAGRLWSPDAADTSASLVVPGAKPPGIPAASGTHIAAAAFGHDGRTVAFAEPDGTIKLWNALAPRGASATTILGHSGPVLSVLAFSPGPAANHRWLASGDVAGTVRLWDLAAGDPAGSAAELGHYEGEILSLAFSPDARWLAAGAAGGPPRLWDLNGGPPAQPTAVLHQAGASTYALAFHPLAPGWLAVGTNTGEILLRNVTDPKVEASLKGLPGNNEPVTRLMFSPNGRRLISASMNGTASLYADPLNQDSRPSPLQRHVGGVTCVALGPGAGRLWLATGGADGEVWLWRLDAERPEKHRIAFDRSPGTILDLAFSGDGLWLAIVSADRNIRVMKVDENGPSPESSFLLNGQDQASTALVLDPAGRLLIAAGPRGTPRVWPLQWLPGLDELVSRLASRNLSADEWKQHFPNTDYKKTFKDLPVHQSLIDAARDLAKRGQMEQATRRLRELATIDPALGIDPEALVKRSTAEGMVENGRYLAGQGNKDAAIEQFKAALGLDPEIGLDPRREADKTELRQEIARIDALLEGIHSATLNPSPGQVQPRVGHADTGTADLETRLQTARQDYQRAAERNIKGKLALLYEIARIGNRLKAIEHDREGRRLAAEGTIDEAVKHFEQARTQAPVWYPYVPASVAQQVVYARAWQADADGRRLVNEGKTDEAVKAFELAVKLQPGVFRYIPSDQVHVLAAQAARMAYMAGRQLVAQGKKEGAVEAFRKAHHLDPVAFDYDPAAEANQAAAEAKQAAAEGNLRQADSLLAELDGFARNRIYDKAQQMFKKAKDLDPSLAYDPKDYVNHVRARLLVVQGQADAQARKPEDAMRNFRQAKELDTDLELDPERLCNRLVGRAWLDQARTIAPTNPDGAKDALKKGQALLAGVAPQEPKRSLTIDPDKQVRLYSALSFTVLTLGPVIGSAGQALCKKGSVADAYSLYEQACDIDPLLNVPANFWNGLCWFSSLRGAEGSKQFAFAGDLAVALEPGNVGHRDTRGLARALQGDRKGAISDFEAYLWYCPNYKKRQERREWIRLLRSDTPVEKFLTPEVLKRLKQE
jgi:WD40 repeat protein